MRKFDVPDYYRSSVITRIKQYRKNEDPRKKDYSPTILDFGTVQFIIARHFGFCYGVENAIEIVYRIIEENPSKNIYLLSEMIHNSDVNNDLISRGVKFLFDTSGNSIIGLDNLNSNDIVVVPAFGTTIEMENILKGKGIEIHKYNTTCPFVEKVWNRAAQIGEQGYSIIIHGKHNHEETRATFSHSVQTAPSLIVRNIDEAKFLGDVILGNVKDISFYNFFNNRFSKGFDVNKDLNKIGVVNQTTMLATETQEIATYLRKIMIKKFGQDNIKEHFADTRDTLCYATNDNQQATYALFNYKADFAIVVGGYNSSNTGHIVELCSEHLPTYFISSAEKIVSKEKIKYFDLNELKEKEKINFIPPKDAVKIILTSGASCPDALVEDTLKRLLSFFENVKSFEEVTGEFKYTAENKN